MRLRNVNFALIVGALAVAVGASIYAQGQAQGAAPPARQGGAPLQNLQVLPKDWTRQQVTLYMRSVAGALGVDCTHCHVGPMADRHKDDNPKKGLARKMIAMTNTINNDHLKGIGDPPAAGAQKVTCFTCHRGALKPLTAPSGGL